MNYAIYCYKEDYKCLELCVGQIRRVDPDCTIYLFDDGKAPLARKDIPKGRDIISAACCPACGISQAGIPSSR